MNQTIREALEAARGTLEHVEGRWVRVKVDKADDADRAEISVGLSDALGRIDAALAALPDVERKDAALRMALNHIACARIDPDVAAQIRAALSPAEPDPAWAEVVRCVDAFRAVMLEKLAENRARKGCREGWVNDEPHDLLRRVREEVDELDDASKWSPIGGLHGGYYRALVRECADVANMAMMVADAAGALTVPPATLSPAEPAARKESAKELAARLGFRPLSAEQERENLDANLSEIFSEGREPAARKFSELRDQPVLSATKTADGFRVEPGEPFDRHSLDCHVFRCSGFGCGRPAGDCDGPPTCTPEKAKAEREAPPTPPPEAAATEQEPRLHLTWQQRADGFWNADCPCGSTLCGWERNLRHTAEFEHSQRHFEIAEATNRKHERELAARDAELTQVREELAEYVKAHREDIANEAALRAKLEEAERERDHYRGAGELLVGAEEERQAAEKERDHLAKFKAYVHQRLDAAGIPTHPDGPHSKEGCRVGDRLDLLIGARAAAEQRIAEALEALQKNNGWEVALSILTAEPKGGAK